MHREIQKFMDACKEEMKIRKWSYGQLSRATEGKLHRGTCRKVMIGESQGKWLTLNYIGIALDIPHPIMDGAKRAFSQSYVTVPETTVQGPQLEDVEAKLRKALNFFRLGAKELDGIDDLVRRTVDNITERLRNVSTLKSTLKVFEKH